MVLIWGRGESATDSGCWQSASPCSYRTEVPISLRAAMLPEAIHIPSQVPPSIFKVSNREFLLCPILLCVCFKSLASFIRLRWLGQTHLDNPPILRSTDLGLNYICNPSQQYLDSCLNNLGGVWVHQRPGISEGRLRILSTTVINCSHCYPAQRTHRDVPAEMGCPGMLQCQGHRVPGTCLHHCSPLSSPPLFC